MRILLFVLIILTFGCLKSQDLNFTSERYNWPDQNKKFENIPDSFLRADAVILKDEITLNFKGNNINRRTSIKILNLAGLNKFKKVILPQKFDLTHIDNNYWKQGRYSDIQVPYIREYKINYFAARIIRKNIITEIPIPIDTKKVFWNSDNGEHLYDYEYIFNFLDLDVGDIIEYVYSAAINGQYDSNQFYINDIIPKLRTTLYVSSIAPEEFKEIDLIKIHNIDSLSYTKKSYVTSLKNIQEYNFEFKNLKPVNYTQNCLAGKTLPHITASIYGLKKIFFNETVDNSNYLFASKFSWYFIPDSLINKPKIYYKYNANIRKFVTKFPINKADTFYIDFFNNVFDSLNSYKYISTEGMHYSKDAQYSLNSGERLMKKQLLEEFLTETYSNILFEKNIFYYIANVQDRRLGFHDLQTRAHEKYEINFIALPTKKSYKFYMPRFNGISFYPDELPFYCEGTYCALFPKNTKATKQIPGLQELKFIKTPISNYNENVRTENAVFKINLDSLIIYGATKENLNGQFSTILRHYYNNTFIDSTIQKDYFKKCTEKPNVYSENIIKSSESKIFPFKTSYNCSFKIKATKDSLNLTNWFSFILKKENFSKPLTNNYYFDFTYTDTYNFMFEFNRPISIINIEDFENQLTNDFFEINSKIIPQGNNKYLLSLTTKAKQYMLPKEKANLLTEYLEQLNKFNLLKLKYNLQ